MIILYPTDTVYGLAVDATDPVAVQELIDLKGRDEEKPISIVVTDLDMASHYGVVTPLAGRLADAFLPGKLTLVLEAKELPPAITAGTGTVGVRIPNHPAPMALVRSMGKPITATSANLSGIPTELTVERVLAQFGSKARSIIYDTTWGKALRPSAPSTVVDVRGEVPIIVREGAISASDIFATIKP